MDGVTYLLSLLSVTTRYTIISWSLGQAIVLTSLVDFVQYILVLYSEGDLERDMPPPTLKSRELVPSLTMSHQTCAPSCPRLVHLFIKNLI